MSTEAGYPWNLAHVHHAHDDVMVGGIRLCAFSNEKTAERIFTKFVMDVLPSLNTPRTYFLNS
jgi:hypothetical protein